MINTEKRIHCPARSPREAARNVAIVQREMTSAYIDRNLAKFQCWIGFQASLISDACRYFQFERIRDYSCDIMNELFRKRLVATGRLPA